jgi:hypothetical protein
MKGSSLVRICSGKHTYVLDQKSHIFLHQLLLDHFNDKKMVPIQATLLIHLSSHQIAPPEGIYCSYKITIIFFILHLSSCGPWVDS